ncbi:glycoside hydrolase family 3 protein [Cylindrobasidium torrendii FP15055 ss-10]|uniref:Glycoside hydrolase family 3 protein n=1 Tax=Cylindrobasidium torrendii FP15055 ss-10 TaxID=1314674 RepID=A0A0D7B1M5_9AGAR|nr:glycoside hydrolase family 3 protein [Cylindrobasidium torrendii FP15055 ss-10]
MLSPVLALLASAGFACALDLASRATNEDGSLPVYKDPSADIEDRINDLIPRMSLEEKIAQLIQGDISGWVNASDPADNTLQYNASGLVDTMNTKAGSIWAGYPMTAEKFVYTIEVGQRYLMENTTLGIPALIQTEGLHGWINGTTFPSPIGMAATFNTTMLEAVGKTVSDEAEPLGVTHIFSPVLDLSRELRWGRVEENFGEDPFLTGALGYAFVSGLQNGARRNVSDTIQKRVAACCKHYAAFGSPHGGLNIAPVYGGERELRSIYLPPFKTACLDALSLMTSYASYDGIPAIANKHLMKDILREEWGYPYWVTTDAGSVDLLITTHGTCETRECAAKTTVDNISGEMGGGSFTFFTLADQVKQGLVEESVIDATVATLLRVKFTLGLFENPYPYEEYTSQIRTPATLDFLHEVDLESIVLLENNASVLPLDASSIGSIAVIGPHANRVSYGDYVYDNMTQYGISPLDGFTAYLDGAVEINYAEGCKLWSNPDDDSGFAEAVSAAEASNVAVVFVGTWSLDQSHLWIGQNVTTGEHVDMSTLSLVGAQLPLVKAVKATGKPTVVVFVSGKPIAEPWIKRYADAVLQQFYPGEQGGLAIAEIIFGEVNPSGKLPVSFPTDVGTTPAFYNYWKGARQDGNRGMIGDDGRLIFGYSYVLDTPVPLWSFGHGLSYTTFNYTDLALSSESIGASDDFEVTVTVHNTGSVDGQEVVQVYLTDVVSSTVTQNQKLVGFSKVFIPAGGSETVTIPVANADLAVWTVDNEFVVEPGRFVVKIGTSAEVYATTNVTVTA